MHETKLISDDFNNPERIERKQFENICGACSKLIQQCNKKDLKVSDLKWQPHYSTVFKQLKSHFELILYNHNSKMLEKLNSIPYLLSLKNNIFSLLNYFYKFIIDNGSLIGTIDHHYRRYFFAKVVHFQFLCHEIHIYFPNGKYTSLKHRILKTPARIWWERNFGEEIFVNLDIFVRKFNEYKPFINKAEMFSFKSSINFTGTNFITTFEFDLFTRLYSPWEKIQESWRIIYTHPAYLHFSTYGDTKEILNKHLDRPGTYVFRVSCNDLGYWTIGYVNSNKVIGQVKIDQTNLIEALVEGQIKNIYLYPNGNHNNPDLSNLNQYRREIVVKNEDLKLYDCFEDFKKCKICLENEKDIQLENCGHQICHACFKTLKKYNKKLCPFCNQIIFSTTNVVNVTNSSVYVDFNPAKTDNNSCNDSFYVYMSSNGISNVNQHEEKEVQSQKSNDMSSLYAEMKSNETNSKLDTGVEICCDINDLERNFSHNNEEQSGYTSSNNKVIPHTESFHNLAYNDEEYNTPLEINNNSNDTNHFNLNISDKYLDHIYLNNYLLNDSDDAYTFSKDFAKVTHDIGATFDTSNDIYPDQFDESVNESNCSSLPKKFRCVSKYITRSKERTMLTSDDIYFCPLDDINDRVKVIKEDCENRNGSNCFNSKSNLVIGSNHFNQADTNVNVLNELSDFIYIWSAIDIERAMRVARYDEDLALDILLEFVPKK